MGRCSGCRWVYGRVTFVASFLQKIYTITGEDALACSPKKKCIRKEEESTTHWNPLWLAAEISSSRHEEDAHVVER